MLCGWLAHVQCAIWDAAIVKELTMKRKDREDLDKDTSIDPL